MHEAIPKVYLKTPEGILVTGSPQQVYVQKGVVQRGLCFCFELPVPPSGD